MSTVRSVIARRDLWHIEHGDSLRIMREQVANDTVDAVITDPPYCSGGASASARAQLPSQKYVQGGGAKVLHPDFPGDTRDQRSFVFWETLWLSECLRIAKEGAPLCVFADWRQLPATTDAVQAAGWIWRGLLPWDKTECVRPQRGRFRCQAEYVVWASKGNMPAARGVGVLPGVIRDAVKKSAKLHMTGKPVDLMRGLVRICRPGGIVLDPFAGSASTGVACLREGRRFLGIEMTQVYTGIARRRMLAEVANAGQNEAPLALAA